MSVTDRLANLSPEQRALFERLRQQQSRPALRTPPPVRRSAPADGTGTWPLSFDQERLWRIRQEQPEVVSWNVDAGSHLLGELDIPLFLAAFHAVIRRHAAFRAVFPVEDGHPVQHVLPFLAPEASLLDLTALPAARRESAGHRAIFDHTRNPFDLARGPLLRLALVRLGAREHLFLLTIHHIATDWITFQILFSELLQVYEQLRARLPPQLPPLPAQFPDYVLWEREWLQGDVLEEEARFWRRELEGYPLVLELPGGRPRPPVQSQRGGLYRMQAGAAVSERLRALARREGATVFMGMLAALAATVWRLTGHERFLLGSNGANRARPELEPVAGFFLTQIPFAMDLTGDPPYREILGRVKKTALAAYAHQNLPFTKLIEALGAADDGCRNPVVQVLLLVLEGESSGHSGGLESKPVGLFDGNSRWDLMLGIYDYADIGLSGSIEYNTDIFDPPAIGRFLELLYRVLDAVTADPEIRLSAMPELGAPEETEQEPAIAAGAETDSLAETLTGPLRRLGAEPGARIGVFLAPSPERDAVALAVRRLGGTAVLLDPAEPDHRLHALLADARLALLVHRGGLAAELAPVGAVRVDLAQLVPEEVAP